MDLGRSALKLFISRSASSAVYFLGIIYFARRLHPDELGSFFLFLALLGIFSIFADVGIRWALEKRVSEGSHPEGMLGSALVFKTVMLGVASVAVLASRSHIEAYLGADIAVLLVVTLFLREFAKLYIQTLRGELRVGETAAIEFLRRVLEIGTGAVLITVGWGVRGLVYGSILGWGVALLWAHRKSNVSVGRPTFENTRSIIAFSKYQTIASIGGRVYQWMDIAIIGVFLTQFHVSVYEISWQVTLLVILVSKSVATTFFPQISQWNEQAATDHIEDALSKGIAVALYFSVPALVGASLYATEILGLIFGSEYTVAAGVLIILMVEKQFQALHDLVEGTVRAIDRPELAARATVMAVTLNAVLTPILVVTHGIVGAAVATTVSWLLNMILHVRYLSRHVAVDVPYRLIGWFSTAALTMGGLLLGLKTLVPVTTVFLLFAQIALGVAVYGCVSFLIGDIREDVIIPGIENILDLEEGSIQVSSLW